MNFNFHLYQGWTAQMLLTYMQTSRPIEHFFHSIATVPRHQLTITD